MTVESYFSYFAVMTAVMVIVPAYYQTEEKIGSFAFFVLNILWLQSVLCGIAVGLYLLIQSKYSPLLSFFVLFPPLILFGELLIMICSAKLNRVYNRARSN